VPETEAVWRTTNPDVVGLIVAWTGADRAFRDKVLGLLAELGLSDRQPYVRTWGAWGGDDQLIGIMARGDLPSADWRRDGDAFVPRRGSKAQKALSDRFNEIKRPDFRKDIPGMPSNHFSGCGVVAPGAERHGDALYVLWSTDQVEPKVDTTIWERIKLSEFYAVRELEDAEAE
jgi:hypothetical protein